MNSFGTLMREMRAGSGKKLTEVARALDVSIAYLSDVENGRRQPLSKIRIDRLALFYGIDARSFYAEAAICRGFLQLGLSTRSSVTRRIVATELIQKWDVLSDADLLAIEAVLGQRAT